MIPNYFCVVLGDPNPDGKNQVEEGWYKPANHHYSLYPKAGDLLLFYCTGNYERYPQQVPGIGVAYTCTSDEIRYTYLSLHTPLPRAELLNRVGADERHRLENLHIVQNFLFPIGRDSFTRVMDDQTIMWP